jgi:hypothetical protein
MKIFKHRINTITDLALTSKEWGVELDIRTNGKDLILHHDPFETGDLFEMYLQNYSHSGIILNTKEEGLESCLVDMMKEHSIEDYFFLDLSLPFLIKTVNKGCKKVAVRYSEYEPIEYVKKFEGLAEWVWVDCFNKNILREDVLDYLKLHFKICLVSPELQSHPVEWIEEFKFAYKNFDIDAVCTKQPILWKF